MASRHNRARAASRHRDNIIVQHLERARRGSDPAAATRVVAGHADIGNAPRKGAIVEGPRPADREPPMSDNDAVLAAIRDELRKRPCDTPVAELARHVAAALQLAAQTPAAHTRSDVC